MHRFLEGTSWLLIALFPRLESDDEFFKTKGSIGLNNTVERLYISDSCHVDARFLSCDFRRSHSLFLIFRYCSSWLLLEVVAHKYFVTNMIRIQDLCGFKYEASTAEAMPSLGGRGDFGRIRQASRQSRNLSIGSVSLSDPESSGSRQ